MRNFRKFVVWHEAIDLADRIYSICDEFPKYELFALSDQLRRAAVSIPSNIAEGSSRTSDVEFAHFLEIAMGSTFEVETQLQIAFRRGFVTEENYKSVLLLVNTIEKRLNGFIAKLRASKIVTKTL